MSEDFSDNIMTWLAVEEALYDTDFELTAFVGAKEIIEEFENDMAQRREAWCQD